MFFPDGTLSAVTCALLLGLTCLTALCDLAKGSADFSGQEVQHFGGCGRMSLSRLGFAEPGSSCLREEISVSHPLLRSARPVPVACLGTHAPVFTS